MKNSRKESACKSSNSGSGRKSTGGTKQKATARENATARMQERERTGPDVKARGTDKEVSQGRFPGETPLTGEDRPSGRAGGKKKGQNTAGR